MAPMPAETDLGRLLLQAHRSLATELREGMTERGYPDIRPGHAAVFMHIDRRSGTRLTILARRARMTKQGMMLVVDDLESRGYVRRVPDADVVRRIWTKVHTVWQPDPTEVSDRLGWLTVHEEMEGQAGDLRSFARRCSADGFRTAVLAGMGGSSLLPEVFRSIFGVGP